MTPFLEFRSWLRDARPGERTSAGVAAVLAVALLGWVLNPSTPDGDPGDVVAITGAAGNAGGAAAVGGPAPLTGAGGDAAEVPGASAQGGPAAGSAVGSSGRTRAVGAAPASAAPLPGSSGSSCPTQVGEKGTTEKRLKVAVTLVNIAGPAANQTFGVPTVEEQKKDYELVIADVNRAGGAGCRKIVAQYYEMNPADREQEHGVCIDISNSDVFAVLDAGAGYLVQDCFGRSKVPYFSANNFMVQGEAKKYFPYLFAFGTLNAVFHDAVMGLAARGFFDPRKGFKKLGYVYESCKAEIHQGMREWLAEAGVKSSAIDTYDVGCPSAFSSPSTIQQVILQFQQRGVTHVTSTLNPGDFANFTRTAQQQRFKPVYGLGDGSLIAVSKGIQGPDPDNLDGATVITASRYAEETTPGMKPSAGTQRCNKIYQAAGMAPLYEQRSNFGGIVCDELWMFDAAVDRAGELRRTALVDGLRAARSLDFSYPHGPADFSAAGTTTAGQFYRVTQYFRSCTCFRVVDPTFRRGV